MTKRALYLDRDGVINVNLTGNVRSWEQFTFEHGSLDALARVGATDFVVIVITNQSGIGNGHMTRETVEDIHTQMIGEIIRAGGRVDAVYYCPHSKQDNCTCRKPSAEMLLRGRDHFELSLAESYFVGDWVDDVLAARNARVTPLLVRTGRGERAIATMQENGIPLPEIFDNLASAVDWLLSDKTPAEIQALARK